MARPGWLGALLLVACGGAAEDGRADGGDGAPLESWAWLDVPGMRCGDGSSTGIAINRSERSRTVVLAFEGGGACWDAATCFGVDGVVEPTAVHLDGFTEETFARIRPFFDTSWAFRRDDPRGPFGDATWVFVPYCTGDLHAGQRETTYDVGGAPRTLHHVGAHNVDAMLDAIASFAPDRIFAVGVSAGGYGVELGWDRVAARFPGATTHIWADGAQLVDVEASRWAEMLARWDPRFPEGCAGCDAGLAAVAAHWRAGSPPGGDRHALTASLQDQTIALFFGHDAAGLRAATLAIAEAMTGPHAAFLIDDASHTMIGSPDATTSTGVRLRDWIAAFAAGAPGFVTVGP